MRKDGSATQNVVEMTSHNCEIVSIVATLSSTNGVISQKRLSCQTKSEIQTVLPPPLIETKFHADKLENDHVPRQPLANLK
jgi:hypothetical protein